MLRNRDISNLYICRRCLNKYAQFRFKNYELQYKYYYYHCKCSKCENMHHIVKKVKLPYIWKLFFTHIPQTNDAFDKAFEKAMNHQKLKMKIKRWLNL